MSQEMSKFLGGIRRGTPQDRAKAIRNRGGAAGGATAQPSQPTQPPRWNQRPPVGGASAAAPKKTLNKAKPGEPSGTGAVPKRATGGGPTRVFQTTATSTLRRRQNPPPPPRVAVPRRIIEVKWIMKPSQSFVPGSESSSEPEVDSPRGEGDKRTKVRASRLFRVPSQRIMHVEELKQAQLQQMHPRRTTRSSRSRSRSTSRSTSPMPHPSSTRYFCSCSSRSVSRQPSEEEDQEELKEVPLQDSKTVTLLPSINESSFPSQSPLQIASNSKDNLPKGSTSSSNPLSTPTSSSLSSSGTECSGERLVRRTTTGRLAGKAIKLTSTVIEIIKPPTATSKVIKKSPRIPREKKKPPRAKNLPKIHSVTPPKLQVPVPLSQSVNHVVNQLTAQLKEAAMMHSKVEVPSKDQDVYQAFATPSRKPSIYLLMNSEAKNHAENPSKDAWVIQPMEQTNRYLKESLSKDHPRQHLKVAPPKDPSKPPPSNITRNPYIDEPKMLSKLRSQRISSSSARTQPVSLNRITRPPYVVPITPNPPEQQKQQQEHPKASKIVRKAQHKVPRTMEDGIDMSYQYFVSIPLKRGKKPQVVRYLYRPMVRQLNAPTSPNRRSTRRVKRKAAAAGGDDQQHLEASQEIDPELKALGGKPLPLVEAPPSLETEENPEYEVPPLKLEARFKPLMEQLAQMPFPEERTNRRRRRVRAAGGAEQVPPADQQLGNGGGDEMSSLGRLSSIWKSGSRLPRLIDYQPEAKRLSSATGASISYHTPLQIGEAEKPFVLPKDDDPMIQAITYDDIEQRDEQKDQKEMDQPGEQLPPLENLKKAVSFQPDEVKVSEIPARSSSSISSSSSGAKTKCRRPTQKSKAKSKGKAKGRK
ncbi:neurofilament heavy polypeptide [Drosophila takahashii]|uniref:neurofilament heavy polypeptide n=1 Tax=Drosophila takahashii TaxID=29030 RepID=UPI001CF8888F|nr:mediator of DNA damage checkpoint protein 1 [Drosophila takahashii]